MMEIRVTLNVMEIRLKLHDGDNRGVSIYNLEWSYGNTKMQHIHQQYARETAAHQPKMGGNY